MPAVVLSNKLEADFPERDRIERAVRAALESASGEESWSVTLHPSDEPEHVAIELVFPKGGVAASSVAITEDEDAIGQRVRVMLQPFCGK